MSKNILLLWALAMSLTMQAQEEQFGWRVMDTARFVCQYEYTFPTLISPTMKEDMRLEIGNRVSKFFSQKKLDYALLSATPEGKEVIRKKIQDVFRRHSQSQNENEKLRIMSELPSRGNDMVVYKNYPKDSIYIQDATSGTEFVYYTEPYVGQDWKILPDTTTHLGYHCQKATCTWRGRNYEAWFTSEIPVNDGPMKFFGLPGLIVKIADEENIYGFELKGIEKSTKLIYFNTQTILKNFPEFLSSTRCEVQKQQTKSFKNRVRVLKRDMAALGKSDNTINENMYDTMERDCK